MAYTVFFWKGKWQILINTTLSGAAHGGRGLPELGGGGWMPLLLFQALSLLDLKSPCFCLLYIFSILWHLQNIFFNVLYSHCSLPSHLVPLYTLFPFFISTTYYSL